MIGIPTLRLKGHYLALATLGFGEIMRHIFFNWREVTHGMDGISNIPPPSLGFFAINNDRRFFYLALAVLGLVMLATICMMRSKYGRHLAAIRDAELAAAASGVHVSRLKIIAFGLSAVVAGFAGSLYAHLAIFISPGRVHVRCHRAVAKHGADRRHRYHLGAGAWRLAADLPAGDVADIQGAIIMLIYGVGLAAMVIFLPMGVARAVQRGCRNGRRRVER